MTFPQHLQPLRLATLECFYTTWHIQAELLWPAAALVSNGLGLSSLELVGTSWNHGPFPHRGEPCSPWLPRPCQFSLTQSTFQYLNTDKSLGFFSSYKGETWIWMLDYQLVSCSSLLSANKTGYKRNYVVRVTDFPNDSCIYFPSLCGNISFQK